MLNKILILFLLTGAGGYDLTTLETLNDIDNTNANSWEIRVKGQTVLEAVHYTSPKDLVIAINKNDVPGSIEFDYRTKQGYEQHVDKLIQIFDANDRMIEEVKVLAKGSAGSAQISIKNLLKKHDNVSLKCKLFISAATKQSLKQQSSHWLTLEKQLNASKPFVICKIESK